jgi:hypothetical protein
LTIRLCAFGTVQAWIARALVDVFASFAVAIPAKDAMTRVPTRPQMTTRGIQGVAVVLICFTVLDAFLAVFAIPSVLALALKMAGFGMTGSAISTRIAFTLVHIRITVAAHLLGRF